MTTTTVPPPADYCTAWSSFGIPGFPQHGEVRLFIDNRSVSPVQVTREWATARCAVLLAQGELRGTVHYLVAVSTASEWQTRWQRWRGARLWTPGMIAFVAVMHLVREFTGWSRWAFWLPALIVTAAVVAYHWTTNRR